MLFELTNFQTNDQYQHLDLLSRKVFLSPILVDHLNSLKHLIAIMVHQYNQEVI